MDHKREHRTPSLARVMGVGRQQQQGTSYRHISLISVIAKTLEKSLLPYITANIPNTPTQHGYKTQHSIVTALHTVNHTIAKGFNQMAPPARTITVAVDMSQVFDSINIHTLIRKLIQTNIPGTIIKFIAQLHQGRQSLHNIYKLHIQTTLMMEPMITRIMEPVMASLTTTKSQTGKARLGRQTGKAMQSRQMMAYRTYHPHLVTTNDLCL